MVSRALFNTKSKRSSRLLPPLDGVSRIPIGARGRQGRVVSAARERARELLRRGEGFYWNATNLSRRTRGSCIDLFARYNARVRIVAVEAGCERLWAQNRARQDVVPEAVIERLLRRWEAPDRTEAHAVEWAG